MKKRFLFVLATLTMLAPSAFAIEFVVDGLRYSVNSDNTTVTVAGYPSGSKPTGDLTIPESVTFGGLTFEVTSIGESAFVNCYDLTSVTIPNSVTIIGDKAFCYCTGLTSVTIGNSVTSIGYHAFFHCDGLTSVTIPNSVTEIGIEAFSSCTGLTSVTIPNSVIHIGMDAFACTAWFENQPDGLVYAGLVAYKYKGTMPAGTSIVFKDGTTGITGEAFYNCTGLTSVTIPSSVRFVGRNAFSSSYELTEIVWDAESCDIDCNSYTESSHPFYSCPIKKLIVGDEVQRIPSYLMYKQIFLTSVIWNAKNCNDFSSSSEAPFNGCTNIKSFEFGSEVETIPAYLCYNLTGLTSVTIPNSVTSIGSRAFYGCANLTSVVWNVKERFNFSSSPFSGCININSFEFGNEVENIPAYLCYNLTGLTSVTIPNSVTSIGDYAFYNCI